MFEALVGGGVGGFLSSAIAHVVTTFADRAGGSERWFQGPYGPPFFNISLFMGVMYGGIAWALSRRQSDVAVGALGPFLGIAGPLILLERLRELPWVRTVEIVFIVAIWGTIFLLGKRLGGRWLAGFGACAGSFLGYLLLAGLMSMAPGLTHWPWRIQSYLPQPTVLLDGLLTGAGIGLGIYFCRGSHGQQRRAGS